MADAAPAIDDVTRVELARLIEAGETDRPLTYTPALRAIGAIFIDGTVGDVITGFTAGDETLQGNGVVSGGAIAAMLDTGIAMAVLSAVPPGQACATITLTVNMMRPARPGRLYVRAGVEKLGRAVAFAHAQLLDEDRVPLATASSSLAIVAAVDGATAASGDQATT